MPWSRREQAQPRRVPAYTIRDTPAVRARVDHDMQVVVDAVRQADPALRALVLTGGFARGEGAVRQGAPQNDYDFVALRGLGRARPAYPELRARLERELGIHVDLQPVWAARLPFAARSIFWYETAARGRAIWGREDLLQRVPVRSAAQLARMEGLRLLVNRGAGLLLCDPVHDDDLRRIQASKALLAALDAHLLAQGVFPPSQRERWAAFEELLDAGRAPYPLARRLDALTWAFQLKVDPGPAPARDARAVWEEGGRAILEALPVALRHAGLPSEAALARADSLAETLYYRLHADPSAGARRWARHPTGRVRAATLTMLRERVLGGSYGPLAREALGAVWREVPAGPAMVDVLAQLRACTLQ